MVIYRAAQSDAEMLLGVMPVIMLEKMVLETLKFGAPFKKETITFSTWNLIMGP